MVYAFLFSQSSESEYANIFAKLGPETKTVCERKQRGSFANEGLRRANYCYHFANPELEDAELIGQPSGPAIGK